jgi:hypothetical protein
MWHRFIMTETCYHHHHHYYYYYLYALICFYYIKLRLTFLHVRATECNHLQGAIVFWICKRRIVICLGRDSSVGIATRYGMDDPDIESGWGARFSALARVQTFPDAHPDCYTVDTVSSSPGVSGSLSKGFLEFFRSLKPSGRTMVLESTQSLTEMSTRHLPGGGGGGVKAAGA